MSKINRTFILLDRTGSMASRWEEMVTSLNSYIAGLKEKNIDCKLTIASFDSSIKGPSFDILRDDKKVGKIKEIKSDEVTPRGMTPLYDSMAKLINLAKEKDSKLTSLIFITDGSENSSKVYKKQDISTLISQCNEKGWDISFLGANFDAFTETTKVGIKASMTLNATDGNYQKAASSLHTKSSDYFSTGATRGFTKSERKSAQGES